MNWLKNPKNRVSAAWIMFFVSLIAGTYCTIWVATDAFEKVLMAISWGVILVTCVDVIATTDVRANK